MGRRILILWNQTEEDVYEHWRAEGPKPLDWDPSRTAPDVGTVAEELDAIVQAIRVGGGHDVAVVNIKDDFFALLRAITQFKPDAIVNLVEFFGDDLAHEAHIAGIYELLRVPYTGSRPSVLANCLRKHRTKALLAQAGLPTAPYVVVMGRHGDVTVDEDHGLSFPVIVKPALEDASGGIEHASVVHDQAALDERVAYVLREHDMPVLIEEYIDGREIHCALLGNDPAEPLPLFEMTFDDNVGADGKALPKIVTFRAKWDPYSRDFYAVDGVCPAPDLEPEVVKNIQDVALRAGQILGVRDYARIDMRLDTQTGEPFILEVNPNPDLAEHGAFMQCAIASGRTFVQTVNQIVDMALARAEPGGPSAGATDQLLAEFLAKR